MIEIEERMYRPSEVAAVSGHELRYIHALIDRGILEAVRPESPTGGHGQWRVYPQSIRRWLGVEKRSRPVNRARIQREVAAAHALIGFNPQAVPSAS